MSILSTRLRLLVVALVAISATVAGHAASDKPADPKAAAAAAAKEKMKKGMTPAEVRKLLQEVGKQRDLMIADFEVLAKQMKQATEEQKKQIKEKMEAQKKQFEEVTAALREQIRDEQRRQRQNAAATKR